MPTRRLGQFEEDIRRARDLVALGQAVGGITRGRVDASDLYRFSLAQSVSALDSYVHGVVLDRAVAMLMGRLAAEGKRSRVGLHFGAVQEVVTSATAADREVAARSLVAQRLALESFQRPDAISDALAMVGISSPWKTAFGSNAANTKTALGIGVQRRHQIVHSCDNDPVVIGALTPLSDIDALDAVQTVEQVVLGLDPLL